MATVVQPAVDELRHRGTPYRGPGNTVVAKVDDYTGPIPRPGEYIVHPPLYPDRQMSANVMGVKTVTYGILARAEGNEGLFVGNAEPYVEIHV
jgi:hypothetical protein